MIVMKFGGTSVGDAERILAVGRIVSAQQERRPLVVVSALAGMTDRLEQALDAARRDARDELEPLLAELERRHRWALEGCIQQPARRHRCAVELTEGCERLRGHLRSIRILGECTPRAAAAVLAFGELTSSRIVAEAFEEAGLPAIWVDPRELVHTSPSTGQDVDMGVTGRAADRLLRPHLDARCIPVTGGFVASDVAGETITLGRGGSDTTAAVLGAALAAEEIQIWTDVDGMMTADPRRVTAARTLATLSFVEAAELALGGARVLHPASVTPAIEASIPVRIRNSFRPQIEGTVIVKRTTGERTRPWTALASRAGVDVAVVRDRRMRADHDLLPCLLGPEGLPSGGTLWCSGASVGLAVPAPLDADRLRARLPGDAVLTVRRDRALVTLVGSAPESAAASRGEALSALAGAGADWVGIGGAGGSVLGLFPAAGLDRALTSLHRRFFEEVAAS